VHIGHVLGAIGHGGRESLIRDLAANLPDHKITLYCFRVSHTETVSDLEDAGVTVNHIRSEEDSLPKKILGLARSISSDDVDVLHPHGPRLSPVVRVIGAYTRTPTVTIQHTKRFRHSTLSTVAERVTRPVDTGLIAVAEPTKNSFAGRDEKRWHVVPNGIDVAGFRNRIENADPQTVRDELGVSDDESLALNVGRFIGKKGQATIVRAADSPSLRDREVQFVIAGSRGDAVSLQAEIDRVDVGDRVSVARSPDDIAPYYAAADLFVFPSTEEGLPIALLEALSIGLPTVASRIPAHEAILEGGTHALFAPPEKPETLARSIGRLIDDTETADALSNEAAAYVRRRFNVDAMAEGYLDVYDALSLR